MSISTYPPTIIPTPQNTIFHAYNSDINFVQSTNFNNSQQPRGKKKKKKNYYPGKGTGQTQNANVGGMKEKSKLKFPCNIFNGYHLTHRCPRMEDIQCYLSQKGAPKKSTTLMNPLSP